MKTILTMVLAALLGFGASYAFWHIPYNPFIEKDRGAVVKQGDFDVIQTRVNARVVLYATATCPYCKMTRSLLASRGVAYAELPVDASEQASDEAHALGARGVPFILIGDHSIEGFDEERILELLAQQKII